MNAPTSGGASLTIIGVDFGALHSASVSGVVCGTTSWTSGTSVGCRSPGGLGFNTSPVVTVALMVGTGPTLFSFDGTQPSADGRRERCA